MQSRSPLSACAAGPVGRARSGRRLAQKAAAQSLQQQAAHLADAVAGFKLDTPVQRRLR